MQSIDTCDKAQILTTNLKIYKKFINKMMWRSIIILALILSVTSLSLNQSTHQIVEIEPIAVQILAIDFSQVVVLFYENQQQLDQYLPDYQAQIKKINETYPGDKTLFAICNTTKDLSNRLQKYGDNGIKIINNIVHFDIPYKDIKSLSNFYQDQVHPRLKKIEADTLSILSFDKILLFRYSNEEQFNECQKAYQKIFNFLIDFNIRSYAIEGEKIQVQIYDIITQSTKSKYMNDLNDTVSLIEFVNEETLDLVSTMTQSNYYRLLGSHINRQLLLIYKQRSNPQKFSYIQDQFMKAAMHNVQQDLKADRVIFIQTTYDFINKNFQQGLVSKDADIQIVYIITDFVDFQLKRYVYDGDFSAQSIINFVQDVRMRRVKRVLKSQQIPENNSKEGIIKIVGHTFLKEIFEKQHQSIIVYFIDSKSPQSYQKTLSTLKQFQEKYREVLKGKLSIATMDLAKNQHQLLTIRKAPQLIMFEKTNKKKPKFFQGQPTVQRLKDWVNVEVKDLTIPQNYGQTILPLGGGDL